MKATREQLNNLRNRKEREAYIESQTGKKIGDVEIRKFTISYYDNEQGALIARFNTRKGTLEIIR